LRALLQGSAEVIVKNSVIGVFDFILSEGEAPRRTTKGEQKIKEKKTD